jgi:hypothetical protein
MTDARKNSEKTHCKNGHEFTTKNVYRDPKNIQWRQCRTCRNIRTDVLGKALSVVQGL